MIILAKRVAYLYLWQMFKLNIPQYASNGYSDYGVKITLHSQKPEASISDI